MPLRRLKRAPTADPAAVPPAPGAPERRPHPVVAHGDVRVDDWYWLRHFDDPAVRAYIDAENRYSERVSDPWRAMRARWEMEWREGRRDARDLTVPAWSAPGYRYSWHQGRLARQPIGGGRPEPVLDLSVYGANSLGFRHGQVAVSPDQRLVAFTFERTGAERFTLRLRDIAGRRDLGVVIEDVGPSVEWLDAATFLFTRFDGRGVPTQVWRRTVGAGAETLVYEEQDGGRFVTVGRMTSGAFAKILSSTHSDSAIRLVPAANPALEPRLVAPARAGVSHVEHHPGGAGRLFAVQRLSAHRVLVQPLGSPGDHWDVLYTVPDGQSVDDLDVGVDHLVVVESGGEHRLTTFAVGDEIGPPVSHPLAVAEQGTFSAGLNGDFGRLRAVITTAGLLDPGTVAEVDPLSGHREVLTCRPGPKGFRPDGYTATEFEVTAADGTRVPLTLFHRRGVPLDGRAPALLHGYGAFGLDQRPGFSVSHLTLADRGWVLGFAHVRGGGELGPAWHAAGRRLNKLNSITDFIACADAMVDSGAADPARLAARGGSAGGLLVCAAANRRPELFRAVVALVPFVDCLTSLLEPDQRLTQSEWDELGNPSDDPEVYRSIAAWSPYDTIPLDGPYPAMLLTSGLRDSRVPFWEPVKFAAKLRARMNGSGGLVLLRTAMESGHNGGFEHYKSDESFLLAFLVSQVEDLDLG